MNDSLRFGRNALSIVSADPRVRRSNFAAMVSGWINVRSRVPLADYLRSRLAVYLDAQPKTRRLLHVYVGFSEGDLVITPNTDVELSSNEERPPRASVRQRLETLELEVARTTPRLAKEREHSEAQRENWARAIASGAIALPSARDLESPPLVSAPTKYRMFYGFAAALVVSEGIFYATPLLDSMGIDTSKPSLRYLTDAPCATVGSLLMGIAIAYTGAHFLSIAFPKGKRAAWQRGGAVAALLMSALTSVHLRHSLSDAAATYTASELGNATTHGLGIEVFFALYVMVSVVIDALMRAGDDERTVRDAERNQLRDYQRRRREILYERERHEVVHGLAMEQLMRAEQEASQAEDELHGFLVSLEAKAMEQAQQLAHEQNLVQSFVDSLVRALETDRYFYVLAANARGAYQLLPSKLRLAPPVDSDSDPERTSGIQVAGGRI